MSRVITQLQAENVMRLSAVHIDANGNTVVIGGDNAQGKSAVLNSIMMALCGKSAFPPEPIRSGEDQAEIVLHLSGEPPIKVERIIDRKGTRLKVYQEYEDEWREVKSPQTLLNDMISSLSFDPLEFTRLKPQDQIDLLKQVVGLDTSKYDQDEESAFNERAIVNRRVKDLTAQLKTMPRHADVGVEKVSTSAIMDEIDKLNERHSEAAESESVLRDLKRDLEDAEENHQDVEDRIAQHKQQIKELEEKVAGLEATAEGWSEKIGAAKAKVEAHKLVPAPSEEERVALRKQLNDAEETNRKVTENAAYEEQKARQIAAEKESKELDKKVEKARKDRVKAMKSAKWPVEGLSFNSSGVTFNDLPFEQCSSAEQLRLSCLIGSAANPELKLMFIRDGSLLDANSLKQVEKIAIDTGTQIWIERVSQGSECSIIIEDGHVK